MSLSSPDLLVVRRAAAKGKRTAGSWLTEDERFWIVKPGSPLWRGIIKKAGNPVSKWWITSLYLNEKTLALLEVAGLRGTRFNTRDDALKALCSALGKDGYKVVA
jgi:hypothetical protein